MKITPLTYKFFKQQKAKEYDLSIFDEVKEKTPLISIHEVINQNSNFKPINHYDIELLKSVRKRKSIKKYLENDFFKPPFTNKNKKDRRFCNFRKWLKRLEN